MKRIGRLARGGAVVVAWIYCLVSAYFAIVWTFAPTRLWWIALSNTFAPICFLPLLLLLPLAALIRTRYMVVAVATPAALFVLLFGPLFIPRPAPAAAAGEPRLRVVSLNHYFGNQQFDAVVAALRASEADVIALQELSPAMAAAIERELGERYPYRWLMPQDSSAGIGLFSRYPLADQRPLLNGRAQQVTLELPDGPLTLVNVHLHFNAIRRNAVIFWGDTPLLVGYDPSRVARQVEGLLRDVEGVDGRLVLVGDFNMGDRDPGYPLLRATLRDAFREAGWGFGFTFPNQKKIGPVTVPAPVVRLDYVWLRGPLAARSAHADCQQIGADHCMLTAELLLAGD